MPPTAAAAAPLLPTSSTSPRSNSTTPQPVLQHKIILALLPPPSTSSHLPIQHQFMHQRSLALKGAPAHGAEKKKTFHAPAFKRKTMSATVSAKHNISKKRRFVADGVFYAELREFLSKELAEDGFSGVEVRKTPIRTEIIIRATRTMEVLGPSGRRIRELTSLVQKRFGFTEGTVRRRPAATKRSLPYPSVPYQVELYAERVSNRGLSACSQAESLKFKLVQVGPAPRRAP